MSKKRKPARARLAAAVAAFEPEVARPVLVAEVSDDDDGGGSSGLGVDGTMTAAAGGAAKAGQSSIYSLAQSQTIKVLVVAVLLIAVTFGLRELSWLVAPVAGTALIVTLIYPLFPWLLSRKVPRILAVALFVITTYLSLVILLWLVGFSITRFAVVITDFTEEFQLVVYRVEEWLLTIGITAPEFTELLDWVDIPAVAGWVVGQIPSVLALGAMLVLVGTALMFQGVEATQLDRRTRSLRQQQPRLMAALELCARRTRSFFGMTTLFAVIVGILDTVLLMIMGIPLAPLWGLLAAACNYVPFLGFWIGLIPPALLALAIHGWGGFALVVVAYLILNFLITSILPTKFVSDAVGLSMVVEVISIVFWAWVLGPIGAILAIPLTLLVKAVLVDSNPNASWISDMLASRKSLAKADRELEIAPASPAI